LRQCGHISDGWSALLGWTKIMSTRDTNVCELTESELDNVSGGEITVRSDSYTLEETMHIWYYMLGQTLGGSAGIGHNGHAP
jgi:bacteriocin-like protein